MNTDEENEDNFLFVSPILLKDSRLHITSMPSFFKSILFGLRELRVVGG